MFDPTVYDNLKVVFEGEMYNLDFAKKISVTNRKDVVDLANMSRRFAMEFRIHNASLPYPNCEVLLKTSMADLASELLEGDEQKAGCEIEILFLVSIKDVEKDCFQIESFLNQLWDGRPLIEQTISFTYGVEGLINTVRLRFNRKINEDQIDDVPTLLVYSMESLHYFQEKFNS
ncbi:hypothetical protein ACERII_06660 [Evansella sp. AB-rgal1]|uniref:hypothetical protein n=1 Tax=Evansella sp. AB-rgal1 TaxID=3242696 RepID=UPI00359DEB63